MLQPFQPTKCRICNGPSDGLHFGVEACRACAAFFRRTVVLNLKYHCRYMGKCVLDKGRAVGNVQKISNKKFPTKNFIELGRVKYVL